MSMLFLQETEIGSLDISNNDVGHDAFIKIMQSLKKNQHLHEIHAGSAKIKLTSSDEVLKCLAQNCAVTLIDLDDN